MYHPFDVNFEGQKSSTFLFEKKIQILYLVVYQNHLGYARGSFESPNYLKGKYENNLNCSYSVTAPKIEKGSCQGILFKTSKSLDFDKLPKFY